MKMFHRLIIVPMFQIISHTRKITDDKTMKMFDRPLIDFKTNNTYTGAHYNDVELMETLHR